MKEFFIKHGWFSSMLIGIGMLLASLIIGEVFPWQTPVACLLILLALLGEGTSTKIK